MAMAVSNQQSRDAALLRAMTELFVLENKHDPDALRRFEELATHYLGRVSAADRAFVAEKLAKSSDAPAAVLRLLGKDVLEIANPILRRSPALGEFDLLTIIAATGHPHHRLIAARSDLTPLVVSALRLTGDAEVLSRLTSYPEVVAEAADEMESEPLFAAAAPPLAEGPALEEIEPAPVALAQPVETVAAQEVEEAESAEADAGIDERVQALEAEPQLPAETVAETGSAAAFLDLDRSGRLAVLRHVAEHGTPSPATSRSIDADQAFRLALGRARLASLARQRQREALIRALAQGLRLEETDVAALMDDPSGEPLVVLLRGIGLSESEAQQVLLFANPVIAQGVESFERLSSLLAETSEDAAGELIALWRGEAPAPVVQSQLTGHQPLFADLPMRRGLHGAPSESAATQSRIRVMDPPERSVFGLRGR